MWSSPKLYDHGFTAGALFFPDSYSYSLPVLPHGRCDLPALIVGCIVLRHMSSLGHIVERCGRSCLKGVPRQGTYKRGNLLSVLYRSLDNLPGEWVGLWAVVGHSPKGEENVG